MTCKRGEGPSLSLWPGGDALPLRSKPVWSERHGSNVRPPESESGVLLLHYVQMLANRAGQAERDLPVRSGTLLQLSYRFMWWNGWDSNPRPLDP